MGKGKQSNDGGLVRKMTLWELAKCAEFCARENGCEKCALRQVGSDCQSMLMLSLAELVKKAYCNKREVGRKYMLDETGVIYTVARVTDDYRFYILLSRGNTIKVTPEVLRNKFSIIWKGRNET